MAGPSLRATSSGSSTTYSCNVTYPTGTVSGDYVVAWIYCGDFDLTPGGTASIDTPTGWTLIESEPASGTQLVAAALLGKFCTGETSETFTWSQPTTASGNLPGIRVQLMSYSNVDTSNPVHATTKSTYSATSTTTVVVPAIATTVADVSITRVAAGWDNTGNTSTWTAGEIFDGATDFGDNFGFQSGTHGVRATPATPGTGDTCTFSAASAHRIGMSVGLQPPQNATVNGSDTGSLADTATVAASVPVTDSVTGTDTASVVVKPAAETGTLTDTAAVSVSATEAGQLTDSATVAAAVPVTDTGTLTDTASVSIAFQVSDSGTLADSASVGVAASDSGTVTDSATVTAAVPATDSGSLTDTAQVALSPTVDTGTLTDSASVAAQASETGTLSDSAAIKAAPTADTGTFTDSASIALQSTETGTLGDTASVAVLAADTGTLSDFAAISVVNFGTESGTLTDDARVIVHASDSGSFFDSAARTDEGRLITPRLYRVPPEDRTIEVLADRRTLRVQAED